jgi:hypothetical protein
MGPIDLRRDRGVLVDPRPAVIAIYADGRQISELSRGAGLDVLAERGQYGILGPNRRHGDKEDVGFLDARGDLRMLDLVE